MNKHTHLPTQTTLLAYFGLQLALSACSALLFSGFGGASHLVVELLYAALCTWALLAVRSEHLPRVLVIVYFICSAFHLLYAQLGVLTWVFSPSTGLGSQAIATAVATGVMDLKVKGRPRGGDCDFKRDRDY
jgi:hypothetical protein